MPFGLQPIHLIIVAVVALLIFGPRKLPEIGRAVGKTLTEFRKGAKEMTGSFMEEVSQPTDSAPAVQVSAPAPAPIPQPAGAVPVTPQNGSKPVEYTDIRQLEKDEVPAPVEKPAQSSNFCIHCGKSNPAGAVYCNSCGSKIAE